MRILFVSHDASRSGAPSALYRVVKSLSSTNHTAVLFLRGGPLVNDFEKISTVYVSAQKNSRLNRFLSRLGVRRCPYRRFLKKESFDIVYANTIVAVKDAVFIKHLYGCPVIAHIHESEFLLNSLGADNTLLEQCDRFIAVSQLVLESLVSHYQIPIDRICVQHPITPIIENDFCSNLLMNGVCNENIGSHEFVVCLSASCSWIKSIDVLPLIVRKVSDTLDSTKIGFLLIGGLPEEDCKKLDFDLKHLKVSDYVSIIGAVDNPMDYFAFSDAFLMISREDSFPLVAQENALLEKPIIAFKGATGIDEWLDDTSCVFNDYLDIDGIANSICSLYNDRNLCRQLGKNAKVHLMEMNDIESSIQIIKQCIGGLIDNECKHQ